MVKESIRYKLLKSLCKITNFKKMFAYPEDKLISVTIKGNKKHPFKIPQDNDFNYTDKIIMEKHHCLIMQKDKQPSEKALLYFFGGGFIRCCDNYDLKNAKGYGKRSGRDVWLPHYPLCTEYCVTETYAMAYQTYKEMIKVYKPENIVIIGFSSGGALAIGLCCHINALKENIPMPGLVIASSPGCVPVTEKEKKEVEKLNKLDFMIDQYFVTNSLPSILKKGQEVPDYMINNTLGDYTNFPMVHVYYATHEVLYAFVDSYKKAFQKYNVKNEIHIEEGLCHCYSYLTFIPEGKKSEAEIDEYLK
ncbi:alpha/beta-hydrolase [Anaeromyces robustus]|uniref:Alpha/beta-hydrolase n=1 Tax=Anaeromyces robustus TaxID=1754192 RepID=A0A1Y1XL98_9FUNG|nr:alpha/beta-hydrolase [Anaeromyces robustus]|eukprot:ORX86539.1 alpha/beta-hydrolase [Anaeromyces robustus]